MSCCTWGSNVRSQRSHCTLRPSSSPRLRPLGHPEAPTSGGDGGSCQDGTLRRAQRVTAIHTRSYSQFLTLRSQLLYSNTASVTDAHLACVTVSDNALFVRLGRYGAFPPHSGTKVLLGGSDTVDTVSVEEARGGVSSISAAFTVRFSIT